MKVLRAWPLALAVTLSLSGCFESDQEKLRQALALYTRSTNNQEAIAKALPLLTKLSKKGDAKAQYMLATMYIRGDGVVINNDEALKLLLESSAHGNGDASLLASQFYSQARYGQQLDAGKAKMLLLKSGRDGSEIGEINLGEAYLRGKDGFAMSLSDAHAQLSKIGEGPYRLPAARSLYDIYSAPNQPLFSPEKATAELELLWQHGHELAFAGALLSIYSGEEFGNKGEGVKSDDKASALLATYEEEKRPQAVAVLKLRTGKVPAGEIIPELLKAVKSNPMEPVFATAFCQLMANAYLSTSPDPSLDIDDLIKACLPDAHRNKSAAQLTLAGAYNQKKGYYDAYKWAYMAYLNGNSQQALAYARYLATKDLTGSLETLNKAATEDRASYASAVEKGDAPAILSYQLPWYTVDDVSKGG